MKKHRLHFTLLSLACGAVQASVVDCTLLRNRSDDNYSQERLQTASFDTEASTNDKRSLHWEGIFSNEQQKKYRYRAHIFFKAPLGPFYQSLVIYKLNEKGQIVNPAASVNTRLEALPASTVLDLDFAGREQREGKERSPASLEFRCE